MFDLCEKGWFVPKYMQCLFDFKSKPRGCLIDGGKIVTSMQSDMLTSSPDACKKSIGIKDKIMRNISFLSLVEMMPW